MNIQQAIRERRAIKHFDPAHTFSVAEEKELLDLIRQSPTSFNIQNWRFVLVKDQAQKSKIREAAWGQAQITDAALTFVICADLKAWDKKPERYWETAPQPVRDYLVPMIRPFYEGKDQLQRDEAMRSVGIAAQTIMLAAKGMGYDSCPMIGFDAAAVAQIINLPADHVIGMIVTVGKAAQPAHPKGGYIDDAEVFITDRFADRA